MDDRHDDGQVEPLLQPGENVPRLCGVARHVQEQVLLQQQHDQHQSKAGIHDAEVAQVSFPRPGSPKDDDRQGRQPDHDHKQVVGNLEMSHLIVPTILVEIGPRFNSSVMNICVVTCVCSERTTQVWDATVADETSGKTIALFRCTQLILYRRS